MRITNQSIDEFIESLQGETSIFDKTIRVSVNRRSQDTDGFKGRNAIKFEVVIQASTVVQTSEGGEYLLQAAEVCGMDYNDSTQAFEGSKVAAELKEKIGLFAVSKGWRILPGIISE